MLGIYRSIRSTFPLIRYLTQFLLNISPYRDVAARNCFLSMPLSVKLCDAALSRDLFPNDYHCLGDNENRPVGLKSKTRNFAWNQRAAGELTVKIVLKEHLYNRPFFTSSLSPSHLLHSYNRGTSILWKLECQRLFYKHFNVRSVVRHWFL